MYLDPWEISFTLVTTFLLLRPSNNDLPVLISQMETLFPPPTMKLSFDG